MPPVGFEPTISGGERTPNSTLDPAATGIGFKGLKYKKGYIYINVL